MLLISFSELLDNVLIFQFVHLVSQNMHKNAVIRSSLTNECPQEGLTLCCSPLGRG